MTRTRKQIAASRRNGAKSKGATTKRGKEIASKNATKHGLLANKPPLLASEDLETFKGINQGLIDKYQPEPNDPIAWHLIHTVAMGILKQNRLWQAEAAIAYQQTTEPPKLELPYNYLQDRARDLSNRNSQYYPKNLRKERLILERTLEFLNPYNDLDSLIKKRRW